LPYGTNQDPFYVEGDAGAEKSIPPLQLYSTADGGYFGAMGIPVLAGRTFDRIEVQRPDEAIISQRTAEHFFKDATGRAAIGKRFRELPGAPWYTIVGVVGSVRDTSLAAPVTPAVYMPVTMNRDTLYGQGQRTMALVVRTTTDPASLRTPVQALIREMDPTLPTFEVQQMREVMRNSMAQLSFLIVMLGAAAVVTLLLGAIGLYGVMAYVVTLRTRELGLRVALGATPRSVAAMLTGQGLTLTAVGIVGGLVLFAVVSRFLTAFLYGVSPIDVVSLIGASLLLTAVAALASWVPARRASGVDPATTLRAD
jgi:hypothetical protein